MFDLDGTLLHGDMGVGIPGHGEPLFHDFLRGEVQAVVVPMKEGARDYLSRCARGGERMAIVTACVPALCRTALERHGLTDCFEEIVFAQELGLEKRDPQVYRIATERLRVSPGDCTLYEDAPSNCAAARLAGMTVVGVYDAFYDSYQEEMRKNSDRYIRSFTELL